MDDAFTIPGTSIRIGWDAILGLVVPRRRCRHAVSQVALLIAAVRSRAPGVVIARMVLNVGIDTLVGSIPLLGDLFDAGFKANRRNLQLLERLEQAPLGEPRSRTGDYAVLALAIGGVLCLLATPFLLLIWLLSR